MAKTKFQRLAYSSVYQELDPIAATLVAAAAAAPVATFDITPIRIITVTLDVTVAALNGLEIWVRGDTRGRWFQLPVDQLLGYGRSDTQADITTSPAGQACFVMLDCTGWSDLQIKAKSGGAAKLAITAGGQ